MKIAIFLPNWIGDVVMATPTLQAVRDHFGPSAHLIGVMRPYVSEVLSGTRWLDQQLFYDPQAKDPALRSRTLLRKLRQERPATILLLPNSLRTGLLGWLSGAGRRVGYAQYGRGPLLTDKLKFRKSRGRFLPASTMDSYLELAYLLGCPRRTPHLELATLPEDEAAADDVWRRPAFASGQGSGGLPQRRRLGRSGILQGMAQCTFCRVGIPHCNTSGKECACALWSWRTGCSRRYCSACCPSAGQKPCGPDFGHRTHQSVRASKSADDQYGQRTPTFRGSFWSSYHYPLRSHPSGLGRYTLLACDRPSGGGSLRSLYAAQVPTGASPMYARFVSRSCLRRGAQTKFDHTRTHPTLATYDEPIRLKLRHRQCSQQTEAA